MNNAAIGVFDSGVGGLTCVKELIKLLPNENIVYLGDTARVPYGSKSRETIMSYARQDIEFLKQHNVKMILVACGTVSSVLPAMDIKSDISISGVVEPAVKAACSATKNNRIGVIATSATIKSGIYGKAIRSINPNIKVVGKACPMFVPLVENGYTAPDCVPARYIAQEYLEIMKKEDVDTLILGCTHYPHLTELISDIMGEGVTLVSSGAELAKYALNSLSYSDDTAEREERESLELYCTDSVELFSENVERFLGNNINAQISKCSLKLSTGGFYLTSKEVSIKLVSRQSDGNTKEETELISAGLYEATEKGYRISYEESEATGFEGSVTTLETEGCRKVTMNRTGTVEANLVVDIGEKQHCVYGTPYGDFMIGITAKTIRSDLDENGGMLFFHYVLDVNSSYIGDFEIAIEVKAANVVA